MARILSKLRNRFNKHNDKFVGDDRKNWDYEHPASINGAGE